MYINRILPKGLKKKFAGVFEHNAFGGKISLSGRGSDLDQTTRIQEELPKLIKEHAISSMVDVPCGDQNWISRVELGATKYVGADIVSELIARNNLTFSSENRSFIELDLTRKVPPRSDLILCRDLFVHLNTREIRKALRNIKTSGATFLLTTTFVGNREYRNLPIVTQSVGWRPLNLESPPFNFPKPLRIINEGCTEGGGSFADKSLGLWRLSDITI